MTEFAALVSIVKGVALTGHTRELTYSAVIRLLDDREWHADAELQRVTSFPEEWLKEVEHEHELERRGESPQMIRLVA
jgi:hypothetical protein